jgi:exodeoxyribonuclease V alpha subunit
VENIEASVRDAGLIREGEMIWLKPFYHAEVGISRELKRLQMAPGNLRQVQVEKALEWVEEKTEVSVCT